MTVNRSAIQRLEAIPALAPPLAPTSVEEMTRLGEALGSRTRLLIKRDDTIPFGFGGNKIRKLQIVAAQALAERADTLITTGGVQSNHSRATAAVAAKLGLGCVLVANGAPQAKPTANALLDRLLGAEVRYVASRDERAAAMEQAATELRSLGRQPFIIPVGASTPHGAAAYAKAVGELLTQIAPPEAIVLSSSSGATQAGVLAGCRLHGLSTRVVGISPDDPAAAVQAAVRKILNGLEELLGLGPGILADTPIEVDDTFVGGGYGIPTQASTEAIELCAQREAIFLDPTYTSKAMAGLIGRVRRGEFTSGTILFWHTGGQVGLFA